MRKTKKRTGSWLAVVVASALTGLAGCSDDSPATDAGTEGGTIDPWAPQLSATEDTGWLLSVWGPSPDDLYAVGGRFSAPSEGEAVRFDGTSWTPVDFGMPVPLLNWVYGFGPNDVTVVGDDGAVLHWDGARWTRQSAPTDEQLWGVWGAAPNDLWAVGGRGFPDSEATILRFDGTEWTRFETPMLMRAGVRAFFKVWGTSADNLYIVGQNGVVLHWNGSELVEELVGTAEDLISLWGTGPDRIAAVGGRGNGVVATWNGTEWHSERLSPLPGLNGVWMRSPDVIHAVGIEGAVARIDFESRTYIEDLIEEFPSRHGFHAVFGDSASNLHAVGGNLAATAGPYSGFVYGRMLTSDE
ncbi:MAG: hypothetical protein AAGF12_22235 [Myxococcota bacterium]